MPAIRTITVKERKHNRAREMQWMLRLQAYRITNLTRNKDQKACFSVLYGRGHEISLIEGAGLYVSKNPEFVARDS